MIFENERDWLSIVRNAVVGTDNHKLVFIDAIKYQFDDFLLSGKNEDVYKGWTFDLTFENTTTERYNQRKKLSIISDKWEYQFIDKDTCYYISQNGIICIHLHSWLWNF